MDTTRQTTVLFADVSGSTRLYEAAGDARAMEAIQPVLTLLRQIGEKYSKTPSQVALRWLIENPLVLPIPGAKNGRQAADNAAALFFALTPEEVDRLTQATLAWRK